MKLRKIQVIGKLIIIAIPLMTIVLLASLFGLIGHLGATFISIIAIDYGLTIIGFSSSLIPYSIIVIIVLGLLRGFFRYIEQYLNHYIAFKTLALLRDKVFNALQKLCPSKLEQEDKGNLISLITTDIELLEVFYAHTLSPMLIALVYSVIMLMFFGQFHSSMALIAGLAYSLIGFVLPLIFSLRSRKLALDYRNQSGAMAGVILDHIRGMDEIIQYQYEDKRVSLLIKQMNLLEKKERKIKKLLGLSLATSQAIVLLSVFGMLTLSIHLALVGHMTTVGAVLSVVALLASFGPVMALGDLGVNLQNTMASGHRILSLLEEIPNTKEIEGKPETKFDGITCNEISFKYHSKEILRNVSLELKGPKIIGIEGKSGSGKSTLLKLMMHFWKVSQGEITINNHCLEEVNTKELRSFESYMTQESHMFKDTILNNLLIANKNATMEEVIVATKKACIHDFIMENKLGYDTLVEELGTNLSGGQRQRLGLARALLHDAPCILLDEPTSNLDSINEAEILNALSIIAEEKLIILVSHRSSTLEIADQRLKIEGGCLYEC